MLEKYEFQSACLFFFVIAIVRDKIQVRRVIKEAESLKRLYLIALAMAVILSLSLIGYGIYINYQGESIIADRMSNRAIEVSAAEVKQRELHPQYEFSEAIMEAREVADVIARVDGIITQSYSHKNMIVHQGDVLVTLSNEEIPLQVLQAESNLKKAQAVEVQTRNSYQRYSRLIEMDATSMEKLDEARANYESAQAAVADAQAQLDMARLKESRLNVTSDAEGAILVIYKDVGNYVTAGTPLFMVGKFDYMWFSLNMDDGALQSLLTDGQNSLFTLSFRRPDFVKVYDTEYGAGNQGESSVFDVDIYGIYPDLSQPAAMRRVVFNVYNPAGVLEARSYEDMILTSKAAKTCLSVPKEALTLNNDIGTLFIVNIHGELEERQVKTGVMTEDFVEILSGVSEGETVVISGVEGLKSGQKVKANMEDI